MSWITRFTLLLVGFVIGQSIVPSHAQVDMRNPDIRRLIMESDDKQRQQEITDQKRANIEAEFKADQQEFQFNYETAILWGRLAQDQDQYFAQKWNKGEQNVGLHLEIKLLKQELIRRGKQADKLLKK